jgi:hypothetical protein
MERRLTPCRACDRHVWAFELACPFCAARLVLPLVALFGGCAQPTELPPQPTEAEPPAAITVPAPEAPLPSAAPSQVVVPTPSAPPEPSIGPIDRPPDLRPHPMYGRAPIDEPPPDQGGRENVPMYGMPQP